jgi:4-amino-4-deoxy-L-arabinose transferase-like glycosyltransferase
MQYATSSNAQIDGLKLLWLLSVLMAFFYNIQGFPLFDLDEGAFSQATREMELRGDYLTTYLNGEPRYDKPILTYWLQALSVAALGVNELAFRLPSAIAATLWNLLIVAFAWRVSSPRVAVIAGALMAGALGVALIGKAATADALLNLFLTGTLFSLYLHLSTARSCYLVAAALCAGLGFLTKGPVALLIPAMVSLFYSLWSGKLRQWGRMMLNPAAWLTFLTVGLPWYIVIYLKEGPGFFEGFIGAHNIGRFTQAMEGHSGPWWYYLPVILLVAFPFGFLILQPLRRFRELVSSDLNRFLIVWFVFVLVFFSFSATKLPHYLLYGLTPLFVLAATQLDEKTDLSPVFIPLILFVLLMLGLPHLIEYLLPYLDDVALSQTLSRPANYLPGNYELLLLLVLGICIWLLISRRWSRQGRLISAGIITSFIVSELLLPLVGRIQQEPIREAALIAARYEFPTVMWRLNNPSFSVYSGRVTPKRQPAPGELVLTKSRHLARIPSHRKLYERQGIALALIDIEDPRHASPHSQAVEPPAPLVDDASAGADLRSSDSPDAGQRPAVPTDQHSRAESDGSRPVGDVDNTWRWAGGHYAAVANLQTPPKTGVGRADSRFDRSPRGTSFKRRVRGSAAGSGTRSGFDYAAWAQAHTWQLSFRPYRYPVRPARMPGALAEGAAFTHALPPAAGNRAPGGYLPQRSWCALAAGYPGRRGYRLVFGHVGDPYRQPPFTPPAGHHLVGPLPHALRPLSSVLSPDGLQRGATGAARYCPVCPGSGSYGAPEREGSAHHTVARLSTLNP